MSSNLNIGFGLLTVTLLATFTSAALFDGCDYTYNIGAGYSYLRSPYYPQRYPASTSCRYKFVAPLDYQIQIRCNLSLPQNGNRCATDYFYLAADGDTQLRGSEQFCGAGNFVRNSIFRSATLAYVSYGGRGEFSCTLYASPQPCDCGWYSNTRIVNGVQAPINAYPSMAYLSQVGSLQKLFCAATIISHRFLISAAHCGLVVSDVSQIIVNVGDHDLSSNTESLYAAKYRVQRFLRHPGYTQEPDRNDIALITTTTNIEWSRGVGPICLPPANANDYSFVNVDVIGWGTTSFAGPASNTLQKVQLTVLQNSECQRIYSGTNIYNDQICTYDGTGNRRDSCQMDSGGPVIAPRARQLLLGIISFGNACGQTPYAAGVNTRVSSYRAWIQQNTGAQFCNRNV